MVAVQQAAYGVCFSVTETTDHGVIALQPDMATEIRQTGTLA